MGELPIFLSFNKMIWFVCKAASNNEIYIIIDIPFSNITVFFKRKFFIRY
jgi:hypothetical protein